VKTGVQKLCNQLKKLDSGACPGPRSGVRRNDKEWYFLTFYEFIKIITDRILYQLDTSGTTIIIINVY